MNTYEFTVTLKVKVEAFDESDAVDSINDVLGAGALCDNVDIKSCRIESERPKSN